MRFHPVRRAPLMLVLLSAACGLGGAGSTATTASTVDPVGQTAQAAPVGSSSTATTPTTVLSDATATTFAAATTTVSPHARPEWLGSRVLPRRDDEFGEVQPTPPELQRRQFLTLDLLPPPPTEDYIATQSPLPDDVLARSSWSPDCPVAIDQLTYLTMTHWGFDGRVHTGEMIVNASVAEDIVRVFRQLFEVHFPIEQMRVIDDFEIDLPPTGDGNDTTSFVCRPAVGSGSWSQHAFGLAVDINPFHNPYLKGDLVLPELASYYVDRARAEPGMVNGGDAVVTAFAEIGWKWGGDWNSLKDWMHFSLNGR